VLAEERAQFRKINDALIARIAVLEAKERAAPNSSAAVLDIFRRAARRSGPCKQLCGKFWLSMSSAPMGRRSKRPFRISSRMATLACCTPLAAVVDADEALIRPAL
jgi:hypothetical protein